MKTTAMFLCVLLTATVSGCRKKTATPETEVPLSVQQPTKAPDGTVNSGNVAEMAFSNTTMLTMGLQEFMAKNGRAPNDLQELVTAKLVQKIPPLPAGYKYSIDAKRKQVLAVKQ